MIAWSTVSEMFLRTAEVSCPMLLTIDILYWQYGVNTSELLTDIYKFWRKCSRSCRSTAIAAAALSLDPSGNYISRIRLVIGGFTHVHEKEPMSLKFKFFLFLQTSPPKDTLHVHLSTLLFRDLRINLRCRISQGYLLLKIAKGWQHEKWSTWLSLPAQRDRISMMMIPMHEPHRVGRERMIKIQSQWVLSFRRMEVMVFS